MANEHLSGPVHDPFCAFSEWDGAIGHNASVMTGSMPSDQPFTTPVVVEDAMHPGLMRRVGSVREAAEVLLGHWPKQGRGPRYNQALRACSDALDGRLAAEEARQAFIEAALEAGIYVRAVPLRG
jgi:hypothetical protein